jgi:2-polyprenyl-3-methyl-5-hydroxy-6-metoxy-1,4-benzoquinol methylase
MSTHAAEMARGDRFAFGENWRQFLKLLTPERVSAAESSLCGMLEVHNLHGKTFLDIGSGSGLFSLAARRLGARVHSFDYDPQSVACTEELRQRYFPSDGEEWVIEVGSVLDLSYLASLGKFDIVYSWGVLHHTGAMWKALENASQMANTGGAFFIAIYNDQGTKSRRWAVIKKSYVRLPKMLRPLLAGGCFVLLHGPRIFKSTLRGCPFDLWHSTGRGMSLWRDMVDWVGGYPFEVSSPGEIVKFLIDRGFSLTRMVTTDTLGCNEFVFRKQPAVLSVEAN